MLISEIVDFAMAVVVLHVHYYIVLEVHEKVVSIAHY